MDEFHKEHGLISSRMAWFVAAQAFLAGGVATLGNRDNTFRWLAIVLPILGFLISLSIHKSIQAALSVQAVLKEKKDELISEFFSVRSYSDSEKATLIEPWGLRSPAIQADGMGAPDIIPKFMIIFWIIVLIYVLYVLTR